MEGEAIALELAEVKAHLPCPLDGHAHALSVQPERLLRDRDTLLAGSGVAEVGKCLHAMPEGVSVLEQQRPVLLERVGVRQEHGLRRHDLLIDDGKEVLDGVGLLWAKVVVTSAERLEELRTLGYELLGRPVGADLLTDSDDVGLELAGLLVFDELHERVEASDSLDDLGVVASEFGRALDVEVVCGTRSGIAAAKHVHSLAALAHGRVRVSSRQGKERLRYAEHKRRDVEATQNVLAEDLVLLDERKGLLRRRRRVVIVHGRGRNLNEVGVRQASDEAYAVAVDSAPYRDDDHGQALGLGLGNLREELGSAVVLPTLVGLARSMREVVARLEGVEDVGTIAQGVAGLAARDDGKVPAAIVLVEERGEGGDGVRV
mmetsp:Transcript_8203/g.16426  ORF Transcript_8203/g.16426 Transcript_8203/m.16426 type:complete len:375 (-) Transcript_8203:1225-2349(-)